MRWPLTIVVMSLVVTVSLALYRLESEVQILERKLSRALTQLEVNRHNFSILAAEWSFLSQPRRIQDLARRHLELKEFSSEQISQLPALPLQTLEKADSANNFASGQQEENPPQPRQKPEKRQINRGERIILAEHGWWVR